MEASTLQSVRCESGAALPASLLGATCENATPIATAPIAATPIAAARSAADDQLAKCISLSLTSARAAQVAWASRGLKDRLSVLKKLRLKIASDPCALASTIQRNNRAETLAAEVLPLLDACRFLEIEAGRILRESAIGSRGRPTWLWGNRIVLRPEPLGIVLIIAPSNYPLMLPGIQTLQAIAAGNAVLIKPADGCSEPVQALAALAEQCGLPDGLIQVLPESTAAATQAMRQGVDKVFLTGSAQTGKAVSRELAESTTPSVMELSGCDAVFVLEDADLELVSNCLLFGLTLNNSQTCMAPRRVFATNHQVDTILALLKTKLAEYSRNAAAQPLGQIQGLAEAKIYEALTNGAVLALGHIREDDSPALKGVAVLDHVTAEMSIAQSDIFAPVLSFLRVDSEQQALELSRQCPFALSASVFGSAARCQQFARSVYAGCVVINDVVVPTADPRVPFGGRGMSGHGMTRGHAGLLEMTHQKAIVISRKWFKPHLQPPTTADSDVLEQLIRLEHVDSPLRALSFVPKVISATLRQTRLRRVWRLNEQQSKTG